MPGPYTGAYTTGPGGNLGYLTTEPQEPSQPSAVGSIVQLTPPEDTVMRYVNGQVTYVPASEVMRVFAVDQAKLKELVSAADTFATLASSILEADDDSAMIVLQFPVAEGEPPYSKTISVGEVRRLFRANEAIKEDHHL